MMRTEMRSTHRTQSRVAVSSALTLGRKHRSDYWLLILCAILLSTGLILVYAIGPALSAAHHVSSGFYLHKQLIAIALSLVAFLITSQVPLQWWKQAYKPLLIAAGLATLLALVLPVNPDYPAHRWVRLGSFSFQSVEVLKFAVMVWLAGFLSQRIKESSITDTNQTLKPILIALGAIGFVVAGIQSDLGSTGVMVAMMTTMAFVAGLPMKRILLITAIIGAGLVLAISATPYRRARLQTYLHPEANCQTTGYQACQALIAVGTGGIVGLGLGSSVQAYGYLPEAANDSIFAIYAEKFGFIGSILLLAVFVAFFARMKSIAERLPDDFSRLLVIGVLSWLSVQSLINIGAMIGLLPLKGITLPFISYGGTSVVFVAAAIGLVFQCSQYAAYSVPRIAEGRNFRDNTLRSRAERA
ncbi:MAG: putative peptidoglycan glycosyltransferase FtsW [Patescibacteria group bacterium]|nr:putative peptidoglycan glycosyltransferase FtsW [Patescibacteria group bacterium]